MNSPDDEIEATKNTAQIFLEAARVTIAPRSKTAEGPSLQPWDMHFMAKITCMITHTHTHKRPNPNSQQSEVLFQII